MYCKFSVHVARRELQSTHRTQVRKSCCCTKLPFVDVAVLCQNCSLLAQVQSLQQFGLILAEAKQELEAKVMMFDSCATLRHLFLLCRISTYSSSSSFIAIRIEPGGDPQYVRCVSLRFIRGYVRATQLRSLSRLMRQAGCRLCHVLVLRWWRSTMQQVSLVTCVHSLPCLMCSAQGRLHQGTISDSTRRACLTICADMLTPLLEV